jgi:CBS domain-containing protein/ribosome-associated translation inhibitor RaiA
MGILEIASKPISVDLNSKISEALDLMQKRKIHQVAVLQNENYYGMFYLKQMLKARISPLNKVKDVVEKVGILKPEDSIEKAIKAIVQIGERALPIVKERKLLGIISEKDLIKSIKVESEINVKELISEKVIKVNLNDSLAKVRSLMVENNVSRVIVVDNLDYLVGIVDNLQFIEFLKYPKTFEYFTPKEPHGLESFLAKDYMREVQSIEKDEFSLRGAVNLLKKHDEVVITENGIPIGIIVPKDIFKLTFLQPFEKLHVSRIKELEPWDAYKLTETFGNFLNRFERMGIQSLKVDFKYHKEKKKGRKKVSLRCTLQTDKRVIKVKTFKWNVLDAAQDICEVLKRKLIKEKERELEKEIRYLRKLKEKEFEV